MMSCYNKRIFYYIISIFLFSCETKKEEDTFSSKSKIEINDTRYRYYKGNREQYESVLLPDFSIPKVSQTEMQIPNSQRNKSINDLENYNEKLVKMNTDEFLFAASRLIEESSKFIEQREMYLYTRGFIMQKIVSDEILKRLIGREITLPKAKRMFIEMTGNAVTSHDIYSAVKKENPELNLELDESEIENFKAFEQSPFFNFIDNMDYQHNFGVVATYRHRAFSQIRLEAMIEYFSRGGTIEPNKTTSQDVYDLVPEFFEPGKIPELILFEKSSLTTDDIRNILPKLPSK